MAFKMKGFSPFNKGEKYSGTGASGAKAKQPKPAEPDSPMTKKSPYYIAEEGDIQADMKPINLKAKDTRKKNTKIKTRSEHKKSKIDTKTAKKLYGKDSKEYAAAVGAAEATKEAKKKSQTGRQKIRTKMQENKDERARKKNINKAKRESIKKTKAEAKFLKNNPNIANIPMS